MNQWATWQEQYYQNSSEHDTLLHIFSSEFYPIYRNMDDMVKQDLLRFAPAMFETWKVSALAADTLLSPANLLWWDRHAQDHQVLLDYCMDEPAIDEKGRPVFTYHLERYSMQSHPILQDMKKLLEFCTPSKNSDEQGQLLEEDQRMLTKKLSRKDPFYPVFLTELAWKMELLSDFPAIHQHMICPSSFAKGFFTIPVSEAFCRTAEAALDLAADRFTRTMNLQPGILNGSFFRGFLTNHFEIDQFFVDFYDLFDVDVQKIFQTPSNQLTEYEESIFSSFLFTGIVMDKWFLTPCSSYLQLIRPIYYTPYRFQKVLNNLTSMLLMHHRIDAELYLPPSYCSITPLGQAVFAGNHLSPDKQMPNATYPLPKLIEALQPELERNAMHRLYLMSQKERIFVLHACLQAAPECWKEIEISASMPLTRLCEELCAAFGVRQKQDYVLTLQNEDIPVKYAPASSKLALNAMDRKAFGDLPWKGDSSKMTLVVHSAKEQKILLEKISEKQSKPFVNYPRVCAQSEAMTNRERMIRESNR